jgi:hypothetical protein
MHTPDLETAVSRLFEHVLRRRRAAPSARSRLRLVAAGCAALALAVGVLSGWGSVPLPVVALLAAVVAAAELVVMPARIGPSRWLASLTEGAVGACLLVGDGAWSVVAVGAGVAAAQTLRRCPRRKRELDLAVRLLATALAQAVCAGVGGGLAGAVAGLAVFWLAGCALLAGAVAVISLRPLPSLFVWIARRSALHTAGSAGVGLLAASLALRAPLGLVGLAAGVAVLRSVCSQAAWRRGEARLFAHLAHAPGRTADASASLLVTAAARLLGGVDVELVVLDGTLPARFAGDERGRTGRSSDAVALDEPWVLDALALPAVRLGRDDGRPTLTAVLHRPGRPRAVLRARRAPGAPDFDRSDLRSVEVLVARADAWLVAPSDGGEVAEEPAVVRVRSSVERLDALATRGAAVAEVAAELHELERAVAALLGTAGVAAAVPQQPPSPAAEWTTTGVVR